MVLRLNEKHKKQRNPDKRIGGIFIEAKNPQMFRQLYSLNMTKDTLQLLQRYELNSIQNTTKFCLIYLHSFDYETIKYWGQNTQLPNNYLIQEKTLFEIKDVALYATRIGSQDSILWDYENWQPNHILFIQLRDLGLMIHIWTFKDDLLLFNSTCNIEMYKTAQYVQNQMEQQHNSQMFTFFSQAFSKASSIKSIQISFLKTLPYFWKKQKQSSH